MTVRWLAIFTCIISATVILAVAAFIYFSMNQAEEKITEKLPDLVSREAAKHKVIYTKLSDINPYVKEAAIASQDERFYTNPGVDIKGTARAIFYSLFSGHRQGASTITEQLAKNIYYGDVDSLKTDIETKILALYITQKYPKNSILEWYLNIIYFGHNTYGIGKAGKIYFGVQPKDLSLGEAAYLIGIINLPGYYEKHPAQALDEAKAALNSMVKNKYITPEEKNQAWIKLNSE